jgi:DNA-directed RNA polymerase subunit beta'
MAPCPECGSELEFNEQYGKYYCYTCQQYPQYSQTPPPPPPAGAPPTKGGSSKTPMMVAGVVVIILIIIAASYFLVLAPTDDNGPSDGNGNGQGRETTTMDFSDVQDELNYWDEHDGQFETLDPGDTLIIEDEIIFIASERYYDWDTDSYETLTYVYFKSAHQGDTSDDWYYYYWYDDDYYYYDYDLTFQGDITDDFKIGDQVKVTLHIISIDWEDYTGQSSSYKDYEGRDIEYFDEMWDGKNVHHLPRSSIELIKSGSGDPRTKIE